MDKQIEQSSDRSLAPKDLLSTSEQLICFYVYSLAMLGQYVIGLRIIKKFLVKFTECSPVFLGNVMRAKALCCEMLLQGDDNYEPVFEALRLAMDHYKTNEWGLGLSEFHLASTLHLKTADHQRSKQHYLNSIQHFTKCNHFRGIALCYKNLSKVTRAQKNFDESLAQSYWDSYLDNLSKWRMTESHDSGKRDDSSLLHEIVLYTSLPYPSKSAILN